MVVTAIDVLLLSAAVFAAAPSNELSTKIDPMRVAEIAAVLDEHPFALGKPMRDRESWERLAAHPAFAEVISGAETLLDEPVPEKTEALFMEFFNTGTRANWERVDFQWRNRLTSLFLAECVEGKGRFIPAIEEIILLLCDEPTWMMPAHQPALESYRGEAMGIDLKAVDVGHTLALVYALSEDCLSPDLRNRIRAEVERRILVPYRAMIIEGQHPAWWLTGTNNWNAVCLAGVTGAALALVEDCDERAFFIAAAEAYSNYFLSGFTPDGYCSEGVSYWDYGYGHYLILCELVYRATEGKVDFLSRPGAEPPARYAGVSEIQNGIYPPFADCAINARPSPEYMYYVNRRLGLGFSEWDHVDTVKATPSLPITLLFSFPTSADASTPVVPETPRLAPRTWFADAGVLICRPGGDATQMAVAMKGGHNAEHHNHNDVGSYLVVLEDETLLVDPGAEVYTQRTFSSRRYESNVINSFGHPVPRVAGQLQIPGPDAQGVVLRTEFTDAQDTLELDLTSAYEVADLTEVRRRFDYARGDGGSLTVTDSVVFKQPQTFETALMTFGTWEAVGEDTLVFRVGDASVRVHIDTGGLPFKIEATVIEENIRINATPTRVAIVLTEPVEKATIEITISPGEDTKSS